MHLPETVWWKRWKGLCVVYFVWLSPLIYNSNISGQTVLWRNQVHDSAYQAVEWGSRWKQHQDIHRDWETQSGIEGTDQSRRCCVYFKRFCRCIGLYQYDIGRRRFVPWIETRVSSEWVTKIHFFNDSIKHYLWLIYSILKINCFILTHSIMTM